MITEDKILHILLSGLYLVFLFERGYFQSRAMKASGEFNKVRENKRKMTAFILIILIAQLWVIGSFIYIIQPQLFEWSRSPVPSWGRWLGAVMMIFGMIFEFSTQIYLGRNYSTTLNIREEHTLVTTGPYRLIRHPMYAALIMVGIGLGLLSASWYFLLPFIALGIVIVSRLRREEEAMIEKFGEEYTRYAQRTGRFFPPVGRKS